MGLFDRFKASTPHDGETTMRSPLEESLIKRLQTMLSDEHGTAPIRLHMRFTGLVQGVGFRWTNRGLAREEHLTGWVMNRSDGSVEMEIQGTPAQLIGHLDKLHAYYRRYGNRIWLDEEHELEPRDDEESFDARYEPGVII